jgi:hypothetical protein
MGVLLLTGGTMRALNYPRRMTQDAPQERPPKKPAATVNLFDFLQNSLQPLLEKELGAAGCDDLTVSIGTNQLTAAWDIGRSDCRFTIYFEEGTVEGRKTLAYKRGKKGELLESFMPPERGFTKPDAPMMLALLVQKFSSTLSWITVAVPS